MKISNLVCNRLGKRFVLCRLIASKTNRKFLRVFPRIASIKGFLVPGQEEWMFGAANSLPRTANIVEIGCFLGRSTASFALACKGSNRRVFSIDTFGGLYPDVIGDKDLEDLFKSGFFERWRQNMVHADVSEYVVPLKGTSLEIAKLWSAPIHLLYIDGSHLFQDVLDDFQGFFPHVVPHGVVALHDVVPDWPGPYKAWHEVVRHQLVDTGSCSTLFFGKKPDRG